MRKKIFWVGRWVAALCIAIWICPAQAQSVRSRMLIDDNWRFALGHAFDPSKDFNFTTDYFYNAKAGAGDGAAAKDFDDRGWRVVQLPHDWVVELPFDSQGDTGHGAKRVGRAYPDSSIGWYRKSLDIPASDLGRRICVQFDGAFRDAQVFLNGHDVGRCASGYDGFECDLTDVLDYGGVNELVVRLDATLKEGWFYEGAGIYRHVWLTKTGPIHVASHGTFVTADTVSSISDDGLMADSAELNTRTTVQNQADEEGVLAITQTVLDASGNTVASGSVSNVKVHRFEQNDFLIKLAVKGPRLWNLQSPVLYTLLTRIEQNGWLVDQYKTRFGIRTLRFDKDKGFFLNGKHVLIKGVCCHQDHAGVGVALPDAVQTFRIKRLMEMGCNALRTSHNPPTPELLDVCDELGVLVLDENRRTGTDPVAMDGLRKLILRDRNHPCVFLWSLGNEEWKIESNIVGQRVVSLQRAVAHQLDPSRLVTDAISGGWGDGSSNAVDVMGFNYYTHGNVDAYHAKHPDQPCIGSEEGSCTTTRGAYVRDDQHAELAAYADWAPSWAATQEAWMNFYAARPFVAGAFVWTGFDYRGETTPFYWPGISSQFGIMDTCGFGKDAFYYYKSCWTDQPMVHVLPHWTWAGKEGQPIDVRCYSNCDQVELLLNGQSLGRKPMPHLKQLKWSVPYAAGSLVAVAYREGHKAAEDIVQTAGDAAGVQLIPDRSTIHTDGKDVSMITVMAVDAQGRTVPIAQNLIHFKLDGPGKLIGVGNGDPACHEPDTFVEQLQAITLSDWRRKMTLQLNNPAEVAEGFDDSGWSKADEKSDDDKPKYTGMWIYRTNVELPAFDGASSRLFISHQDKEAQIYLNGERIDDGANEDHLLKQGRNTIAVVGKVEKDKQLGGVVRLTKPAAAWQRSVFNGLAQVIVQSTEKAGDLTLTASGDGLREATVTIKSKP